MKKILTKSFAAFLTMVMLFTAIPMNAFAVNEQADIILPSSNDELVVDSPNSNSLGNIISESIDNEIESQSAEYIINWVEAEGTTVTVEFSCYDTCNLVVAIYTEDGRMIGSANKEVTSEMVAATLDVAVKNLPEYYLIKAFLLDSEMYAKCDEYVCTYYTRDFQEFLALTVDDFPEENVINLDESKDNNFAVVRGDAIITEPGENTNVLLTRDDEKLIYTFENPDENLAGISAEDIFYYPIDDYDFILVKVLKAETKGNVITVYGESEATEEDLFAVVKIDFTSSKENTTIDTSDMDSDLEYLGETDYVDPYDDNIVPMANGWEEEKEMNLGKWDFGFRPEFGSEAAGISGSSTLGVAASAELKYYFSSKVKNIYFKIKTDLFYNVEITASLSKNFKICSVEMSFYKIVAIGLDINFVISVTGKIAFGGSVSRSVGMSYINEEFRRIDEKQDRLTPAVEVSAVARVGLEVGAYVRVLTVKFSLNVQVGFEAKVVGTNPSDTFKNGDDVKHMCGFCFEGDISFYVALTFKIDFLLLQDKEFVLVEEKYPIFKFHNSQQGVSGPFVYEKTACTNKLYKQSVTVKTINGQFVEDALVAFGGEAEYTDEYGTCFFYCDKGEYRLKVSDPNFNTVSETVKVQRKPGGTVVELESNVLESIEIVSEPYKKDYFTGDNLDTTGLKVIATYYDGRTIDVSNNCVLSQYRLLKSGKQEITVNYQGFTDSFEIDVTKLKVVSSKIISLPQFYINDISAQYDLVVELKLNNGTTQIVKGTSNGVSVSPKRLTEAGKQSITFTYNTAEIDIDINVIDVESISVASFPEYYVGDKVASGLIINVRYADGTERNIAGTSFGMECSTETFVADGLQTITVTYGGYTAEFETNVSAVWPISLYVEPINDVMYVNYNNGDYKTLDIYDSYGNTIPGYTYEEIHTFGIDQWYKDPSLHLMNWLYQMGIVYKECHTYGGLTYCFEHFDPDRFEAQRYDGLFVIKSGLSGYLVTEPSTGAFCFFAEDGNRRELSVQIDWLLFILEMERGREVWETFISEYGEEEYNRLLDMYRYWGSSLYIGEGVTYLYCYNELPSDNNCFISALHLPSTLACLSEGSFANLAYLEEVNWAENDHITELAKRVFAECPVKEMRLDKLKNLVHINSDFCYVYSELYLPASLDSLPDDISLYKSVHFPVSVDEWLEFGVAAPEKLYLNEEIIIEIPNGTTMVDNHPFANCATVKKVVLPASIEDVSDIFVGCYGIEELHYSGTLKDWCSISFSSAESNPAYYADNFYVDNELVEGDLLLPDDITYIADFAFSIGGSKYCDNKLNSVTIPGSVINIGNNAFYGCNITSVKIADGVETVGNSAFSNCSALLNITLGKNVKTIGEYAFESCKSLTDVTIPDGVETIGNNAFSNCSALANITIGKNAKTIGEYAFYDCESLTSVIIPGNVETIGNSAFERCLSLTDVVISDGVETIGEEAFLGCHIASVTLGKNVKTIGTSAFFMNDRMNIYYTGDITDWCENKINGRHCLLTDAVKLYIGGKLVEGELVIPDGVTAIEDHAFYGLRNLTSVTVPDTVITIGRSAFSGCIAIESVAIGNSVETIGDSAFYSCSKLTSVAIGNSVETIGDSAFYGCSKLTSVIIPNSVKSIEWYAFSHCDALKSLTLGNSLKEIYSSAFYDCDSLISVIIPDGVTAIDDRVFYDCDSLTSVTIPDGVTAIDDRAFYDCDSLISVTIPSNVETIDDYAFYSCDNLQSVAFERNSQLGLIDQYAFAYCVSLETIDIPTSVHTIGYSAFYGCSKLNKITISDEIEDIGGGAFDGCDDPEIDYGGTKDEWDNLGGGASPNNPGVNYETGTNDYTAITAGASGTIPGNLYTLVVFNNYNGSYDLSKLSYVATQTAKSSEIEFTFIPKKASGITVFILGEFENGEDQGEVSLGEVKTEKTVRAESVSLSAEQLDLYAWYGSSKLTATVLPEDAHIKDVLWSSSNDDVVQVDAYGTVYPKNPGTAIVTVKTADGGFTADCTVNVTELEFNITWNINGEKVEQKLGYKAEITPPEVPERTGYTFTGWNSEVPQLMPKSDLVFTALYVPQIFTATFDANGGAWANGSSVRYVDTAYDSEIVLDENPVKLGYVFAGWMLSGEVVESLGTMDSVKGKTFTAKWVVAKDIKYTVETYLMNIDGEYVKSSEIFTGETNKTVSAEYTVSEGFTLNRDESVLSGQIAADGSLVLKVYIDRNKYNLTICIDSDKTVTEVYYGAAVDVVAPENKAGYTFNGWSDEIPDTMPAKDLEFTAQWTANPHTVTWVIDGKETVHNYKYGDTIKVPKNPEKQYYTFGGWTPTVPDTVPDKDLVFYASWNPIIYNVTWIIDDTEIISGYKFGDKINVHPDPSKTGYTFKGWSSDVPDTMPGENLEFRALWTPNAYNAVFDANGGMFADGSEQDIVPIDFDSIIFYDKKPVLQGYRFLGWSADGETVLETLGYMNSIKGRKFVALWAESDETPYTVETYTMNADGEYVLSTEVLYGTTNADVELTPEIADGFTLDTEKSVLNGKIQADGLLKLTVYINRNSYKFTINVDDVITVADYLYGAKLVKPENPTKIGHSFDCWSIEIPDTMPAKDLSVKAIWQVNSYNVTWIVDSQEIKETYKYGSAINKSEPVKVGHTFAGWDKQVPDTMPAENLTFTARWTANSYDIVWVVDGAETKETYTYGSKINTPANPVKEGYTFTGWGGDIPATMPASKLTFTAQWSINNYNVTWIVDGVETKQVYKYGDKITAPAAPTKEGHTFVSWSKAVPATMPAEDLTFTVVWDTLAYDVIWIVDGIETKETYNFGSAINTPVAPAKTGYTFTGWDNEIPATMPANGLTFTAQWQINSYTLTWIVDGTETKQTYQYGADVTAVENPTKEGYTFTGWSREVPTTMPAQNVTITAQWLVNIYTVNWKVDGKTTVNNVAFGSNIVKPSTPVKVGYKFIGWTPVVPGVMPAENLEFTAQFELLAKELKIKNPSVATVNYGETLILHADLGDVELPEGWTIQWTVEGSGFSMTTEENGMKCKATSTANGNATVKATLVDENGNAVLDADNNEISDIKQLTSKAGFWQKLVSFFKNLFRVNRTIAG